MKIKLTASERFTIGQFLPAEGNTSEQVIGKSILDKTKLSKEEKAKIKPDLYYQGEIATNRTILELKQRLPKSFAFSCTPPIEPYWN